MGRTIKQGIHDRALMTARTTMNRLGYKTKKMPENQSKYDLLIEGKVKLEVKASNTLQVGTGKIPKWRFNLHRHGVLQPTPDFYWLYLGPVWDMNSGISLVVPGADTEGQYTLSISPRSLLTHWAKYYMRVDLIVEKFKNYPVSS